VACGPQTGSKKLQRTRREVGSTLPADPDAPCAQHHPGTGERACQTAPTCGANLGASPRRRPEAQTEPLLANRCGWFGAGPHTYVFCRHLGALCIHPRRRGSEHCRRAASHSHASPINGLEPPLGVSTGKRPTLARRALSASIRLGDPRTAALPPRAARVVLLHPRLAAPCTAGLAHYPRTARALSIRGVADSRTAGEPSYPRTARTSSSSIRDVADPQLRDLPSHGALCQPLSATPGSAHCRRAVVPSHGAHLIVIDPRRRGSASTRPTLALRALSTSIRDSRIRALPASRTTLARRAHHRPRSDSRIRARAPYPRAPRALSSSIRDVADPRALSARQYRFKSSGARRFPLTGF
jgi:hypothetical protein